MARRSLILLVAVVLASMPPSIGASGSQDDANVAGIVIDQGDGSHILVSIAFTEESIPAIDLLERSGLETLTVPFGGLGDGVCMIEATGCDVTACRRTLCQSGAAAPFWQFLARDQGSDWSVSPLGASAVNVSDGDLTAWIWTAEPPTNLMQSYADVLARTGVPTIDEPARFPMPTASPADTDRRDWLTGIAMLSVTCAIGGGLILRSRHVAR